MPPGTVKAWALKCRPVWDVGRGQGEKNLFLGALAQPVISEELMKFL